MRQTRGRLIVLLAALGCAACAQHTPQAPPGAAQPQPAAQFNADFIKVAPPVARMVNDTIPVTGKLTLDKQRTRIASARVAGRLGRIFVFEGKSVRAGQPLAEIYSPEYVAAQNEYLLARRFKETLALQDAASDMRADSAATLDSAGSRLLVLGATSADIAELAQRGKPSEYLQVRAPISGVVTARNVDPGAYLNVGDALMSLANLDNLWLVANTYDSDYASLRLGQRLEFQSPSLPGESFHGLVAFIAPSIDPGTHTLPIRCDVPNPGARLRAEMFITGSLQVGTRPALIVPRGAVIHLRDSDFVIVQEQGQHYRRIAIQGHALGTEEFAIFAGLEAGRAVVSDGALLLNETLSGE